MQFTAYLQSNGVKSKASKVLGHIDAVIRAKARPFGNQLRRDVVHFCTLLVSGASSPEPGRTLPSNIDRIINGPKAGINTRWATPQLCSSG